MDSGHVNYTQNKRTTTGVCIALPCDSTRLPGARGTAFARMEQLLHGPHKSCKPINPGHWCVLPFRAQIKWGKSFPKTKEWKQSFFSGLVCSGKWGICGGNARVLSKRQLFRKRRPNESWQRDGNSSPWELMTFWHLFSLHIASETKPREYFH